MAHISSIGAGLFSDLSVHTESSDTTIANKIDTVLPATQSAWEALFTTASSTVEVGPTKFVRVGNVREFPAMGTPPNIVNVPTYGQKTTKQIQGQSDAPNLEITVNYVPSLWESTSILGNAVGDGVVRAFRFALLNSDPTVAAGFTGWGSDISSGIGLVPNTTFFWLGKIEAMLVTPQLTDANQATVTISIQSAFYGAWTTTTA